MFRVQAMRFSSQLNGPCSDERGFAKEVSGSHFSVDTMMYFFYLKTLHGLQQRSLTITDALFSTHCSQLFNIHNTTLLDMVRQSPSMSVPPVDASVCVCLLCC
jgi:hypothetical protein